MKNVGFLVIREFSSRSTVRKHLSFSSVNLTELVFYFWWQRPLMRWIYLRRRSALWSINFMSTLLRYWTTQWCHSTPNLIQSTFRDTNSLMFEFHLSKREGTCPPHILIVRWDGGGGGLGEFNSTVLHSPTASALICPGALKCCPAGSGAAQRPSAEAAGSARASHRNCRSSRREGNKPETVCLHQQQLQADQLWKLSDIHSSASFSHKLWTSGLQKLPSSASALCRLLLQEG